jgi:hypothetical protein
MLDTNWKEGKLPFTHDTAVDWSCARLPVFNDVPLAGHSILIFDRKRTFTVGKWRGESTWLWHLLKNGHIRDELPEALWQWLSRDDLLIEHRNAELRLCPRCECGGTGLFSCPCGFSSSSDCARSCRVKHRGNCPTWRRDPSQIEHGREHLDSIDEYSSSDHFIAEFDFHVSMDLNSGLDEKEPLAGFLRYDGSKAARWLDSKYI